MPRPARVVYLVESPYNRRDHERFGAAVFEARGLRVEAWDLTSILHPRVAAESRPPDPIDWAGLRTFPSRAEAFAALESLGEGDFIFCILGYETASLGAFRALSRSRAPYAVLSATAIPSAAAAKAPPISLGRLTSAALMRTPPRWLGVRPPALAICGGERSRRTRPPAAPETETLWTHALDYDLYLSEKDGPRRGKTAVFLDEYVPYHPDYVRLGVPPYSTAERYYPALKTFFERFEAATGLEVVVAAHPRSRYEEHPDALGGRRAERGRTVALVRESSAVIAHASTSVGFAVLFGLPVVFTTTDDLAASPEGPIIEAMARALGRRPVNLDRLPAGPPELAVDEAAYREYRRLYLKKEGTPELPLWEIVARRLGL